MVKVYLKDKLIAESNDTVEVEGNLYFPLDAINKDLLESSSFQTTCPWKGIASYYHLNIAGEKLSNKVWYYPAPKDAAKEIKDRIAFYQVDGIKVVED